MIIVWIYFSVFSSAPWSVQTTKEDCVCMYAQEFWKHKQERTKTERRKAEERRNGRPERREKRRKEKHRIAFISLPAIDRALIYFLCCAVWCQC